VNNSETRKRLEEKASPRFTTEGFAECVEFDILGGGEWCGSVSITDYGAGTRHIYRLDFFNRVIKRSTSLDSVVESANTILDGFHKAGFEVVA